MSPCVISCLKCYCCDFPVYLSWSGLQSFAGSMCSDTDSNVSLDTRIQGVLKWRVQANWQLRDWSRHSSGPKIGLDASLDPRKLWGMAVRYFRWYYVKGKGKILLVQRWPSTLITVSTRIAPNVPCQQIAFVNKEELAGPWSRVHFLWRKWVFTWNDIDTQSVIRYSAGTTIFGPDSDVTMFSLDIRMKSGLLWWLQSPTCPGNRVQGINQQQDHRWIGLWAHYPGGPYNLELDLACNRITMVFKRNSLVWQVPSNPWMCILRRQGLPQALMKSFVV